MIIIKVESDLNYVIIFFSNLSQTKLFVLSRLIFSCSFDSFFFSYLFTNFLSANSEKKNRKKSSDLISNFYANNQHLDRVLEPEKKIWTNRKPIWLFQFHIFLENKNSKMCWFMIKEIGKKKNKWKKRKNFTFEFENKLIK